MIMNTMPAGQKPINTSARTGDDLTAIKGIGPARQRWLKESLNVHSYRDLAALPADEMESQLKADGQVISRGEIDSWVAQARELALAADPPAKGVELADTKVGRKVGSPAREREWQPFASFVVEFQAREPKGRAVERRTMVHHMEADRSETWPGIEGKRLCRWILGQLTKETRQENDVGAPIGESPAVGSPVGAQPAETLPVTVRITQLRAFQPPQTDMPSAIGEVGRPFQGIVRGDEPFALAACLALAGPAAYEITKKQATYRAQFYACNLPTGERTHLGDTKPETLIEGKLSYTAVLKDVSLPRGMYRLRVATTLQDVRTAPGYLEVPLLQVV
jgi:hypothetical protein